MIPTRLVLSGAIVLASLIALDNVAPAYAQSGPYDRAKAIVLASSIEGVKIQMPLSEAQEVLAAAGYVTPPQPTAGQGRYAGRPIPPLCSPGRPPIEGLVYNVPSVPRDYRELKLKYACASMRVVSVNLVRKENLVRTAGTPQPPMTSAALYPEAKAAYEEICGPFVPPVSGQTQSRELSGPPELYARLACNANYAQAAGSISRIDGGAAFKASTTLGVIGGAIFGYSRELSADPVQR